ncbi:hypothetical protein VNO77_13880 [Canavalia gladiata]|uniref:Uncharacterized protein n=1 Tax=Canavalia gladiata TaxID=3824 RepID=A0AAN9QNH8_CANGL
MDFLFISRLGCYANISGSIALLTNNVRFLKLRLNTTMAETLINGEESKEDDDEDPMEEDNTHQETRRNCHSHNH